MNVPVEISFRNVPKQDWVRDWIQEKAGKLEEFSPNLSSLRVAVEQVQNHQETGRPFRVRLDMTVPPGHELAVVKEQGKGQKHETLQDVLESAFHSAETSLRRLHEKQTGKLKQHPRQEVNGFVETVFKDKDYGFLKALDGHVVYFHRHSLRTGDFDQLRPDTGVHVIEEAGEKGPQAVAVYVVEAPEM